MERTLTIFIILITTITTTIATTIAPPTKWQKWFNQNRLLFHGLGSTTAVSKYSPLETVTYWKKACRGFLPMVSTSWWSYPQCGIADGSYLGIILDVHDPMVGLHGYSPSSAGFCNPSCSPDQFTTSSLRDSALASFGCVIEDDYVKWKPTKREVLKVPLVTAQVQDTNFISEKMRVCLSHLPYLNAYYFRNKLNKEMFYKQAMKAKAEYDPAKFTQQKSETARARQLRQVRQTMMQCIDERCADEGRENVDFGKRNFLTNEWAVERLINETVTFNELVASFPVKSVKAVIYKSELYPFEGAESALFEAKLLQKALSSILEIKVPVLELTGGTKPEIIPVIDANGKAL